jgi:hypothetical protein
VAKTACANTDKHVGAERETKNNHQATQSTEQPTPECGLLRRVVVVVIWYLPVCHYLIDPGCILTVTRVKNQVSDPRQDNQLEQTGL